jgi:ketosteroid isomerase-like protein
MKTPRASFLAAALLAWACLLAGPAAAAPAPPSERAAVLHVVEAFFDAMRARDGDALQRLAQPDAQLASVAPGAGLNRQAIEAFAARVHQAPAPFNERFWAPDVLIDGPIAVVWTRYDFHRGQTFTHNGRDCFVLQKGEAGWRIVSLAYSVEPAARTENPAGSPKD